MLLHPQSDGWITGSKGFPYNPGDGLGPVNPRRRARLVTASAAVPFLANRRSVGGRLPPAPGSSAWAFKQIATVVPDELSTSEISGLESNRVNHDTTVAGINITRQGTASSGQFIDIQRTIDAFTASIQEEIFAVIVNQEKLPYTNGSVSLVKGTIRGALRAFQDDGALNPEVDPTVTAPRVEDIAAADRANRLLPDV